MVLVGYPDTRLDFRRSLGPSREKTAGHVSAYRVCDVNLKLMIYASLPNTGNGKIANICCTLPLGRFGVRHKNQQKHVLV